MKIYLIRHASALDPIPGKDDTLRDITKDGKKDAKKTALVLRRIAGRPDAIIASPLTRAVQTAQVIAKGTGFKREIMLFDGLKPDAAPDEIVQFLNSNEDYDKVFIVGHQPLLGKILARITNHGKDFDIEKCGVYIVTSCGNIGQTYAHIDAYITPSIVRKLL